MRFTRLIFILCLCVVMSGCADVKIPKMAEVFKEPLGKGSIKIGMTKAQVVSVYGEPNLIRIVNSEEWSSSRDEWVYNARYPVLPVGAGYLSEDLYLYFDGKNLTHISRKPLGNSQKPENDEDSYIK